MSKNGLADTLIALTDDRNCVIVRKPLVYFTGSLEAAMLFNQLLYWTPRSRMDGWIAKSDAEFSDEVCLSPYAVRKARERLVSMGILETKVKKFNGAPTTHYRLIMDQVTEQWGSFVSQMDLSKSQNPFDENDKSITETTSEIYPPPPEGEGPEVQNEDNPSSFNGWVDMLRESTSKQAVLVRMHEALYPDRSPPQFSFMAKIARDVGGARMMAKYLWEFSPRPPTGDILTYIRGTHKGRTRNNGKYRHNGAGWGSPGEIPEEERPEIARGKGRPVSEILRERGVI